MSDQVDLLRRADQVLPGGVLGSHRSGPGLEFVVKEGRGAYLYDMAGRRYLDYLLGSGPMLLGHAHPAVVEAVERQMARGTSYFLLNEPAIELAAKLAELAPGDAVLLDGLAPHYSEANRGDSPRRVLVASYAPATEGYSRDHYYSARADSMHRASAEDGRFRISTLADFEGIEVAAEPRAEDRCTHPVAA